ncbi:LysR family transcriptional regulator [Aurantimonas sp. VKM B-3413]|uniref:LysR family transcriptional regulator n=1 Tax=Aurantimonas sp. VKM B-3413 TaxID=2779401 RepID=UPI001E62175C|nr:LysR family transcriptional regulator [Aurantimonas sp. VKM B-3413]MCB8838299.1 LysR family transcriptional regulator [Aurantimonas sp. VKM B-3413]
MRRLDNIDLRLIRVFVELADSGGFGPAQIALNLSQSTLSTHIATLEKKLGNRLCERGRGGFRLTEFGKATYAAAKLLFADIDSFHARIGKESERLTGRLRIGIVDGVVTSPELGLQTALGRYHAYAPDVFVDLWLATPSDLERALADGRRDLVIGPMSQKISGITYKPIWREPHALYCGGGHPLFSRPDAEISAAEIEAASFSVRGYLHFDDIYRAHHPRPEGTVMQMEGQAMMILSGAYVGFLPRHIGDPYVARGEMRALKPSRYSFSSQHFIAVRTGDRAHPPITAFVEEVRGQMRRETKH